MEDAEKRPRISRRREWAEHLCKSMLGATAPEAACAEALERVRRDIESAVAKEAPLAAALSPDDDVEFLRSARRLLMRALQYLAARCRQLQGALEVRESAEELRQRLQANELEEARLRGEHGTLSEALRVLMAGHGAHGAALWVH